MKRQLLKVDTLKNLTLDMHQGINTVTENVVYLEKGIPILQSKHITKGYLNLDDTKYLSEKDYLKYKDKYQANVDDVLVCNIGTIGKSLRILKADKFLIAWNLFLIKLDKTKLYSQYFAHYLNHLSDKNYFDKFLTGGTVKFINKKTMGNIEVPLPPLDVQQKIASILDAADTLRQKDKALLAKYDELTQALFLDMFGDIKNNPKNFPVFCLDSICIKITDGEHGTVDRINEGRLYLMARNIRDNFIDLSEVSFISEENHQKIFKRCNAEEGDILLVCVGATIGRMCIMPQMEEFSLARSVALLKPNKELVSSHFLYSALSTNFIQGVIKRSGNSSAQAGLYTGKIKKLEIFLPPIQLQRQFAERVAIIEQQKTQAQASLEKSEELFNSLLKKAFNGELVA
jgi:type I restriction enzyme S subunit